MRNLFLIDTSMKNTEHVFFNAALINIMSNVYPQYKVVFYGDKKHIENLKNEFDDTKDIEYKAILVLNHVTFRILISDLYSAFSLALIVMKTNKKDVICLLNRLPITLIVYNVLNLFLKRKTYSILHGELEYLVNPSMKGLTRMYYKLFYWAYYLSISTTNYVVLGESIKNNIRGINFRNARLITIDHPYNYDYNPGFTYQLKDTVKIGLIGKAMVRKRSSMIFDLAEQVCTKRSDISFSIVGAVDEEVLKNGVNQFVYYKSVKERLPKEEFSRLISELDYSLLFYDANVNIALASGSFFDCIKYKKPIIALYGNPFVDYYFNLLGNIGYQFYSLEEMAAFLIQKDFIDIYKSDYEIQVENLDKAQNKLSISSITDSFKKQIYT